MYNATLSFYYNSIDDKEYAADKQSVMAFLDNASENNDTNDNDNIEKAIVDLTACERVSATLDLMISYVKNIIRMGYSCDAVVAELNELSDLAQKLSSSENKLVYSLCASQKGKDRLAEKYPMLLPGFALWREHSFCEVTDNSQNIRQTEALYNEYVNLLSGIEVRLKGERMSLPKALSSNDAAIRAAIDQALSPVKGEFERILVSIKKIQSAMLPKPFDACSAIESEYGIPSKTVKAVLEFCNERGAIKEDEKLNGIYFEYADAVDICKSAIGALGGFFPRLIERVFDCRMIDYKDRQGKQSGSFTNMIHKTGSGICSTVFLNNYKDVTVLAHEIGHIIHGMILSERYSYFNSDYSVLAAETVATVFERLVQKEILSRYRINSSTETVRTPKIKSFINELMFEISLFENAEKGVIDVSSIRRANNILYPTVRGKNIDDYNWICSVHNFLPENCFYNFIYIFAEYTARKIVSGGESKIAGEKILEIIERDLKMPFYEAVSVFQ